MVQVAYAIFKCFFDKIKMFLDRQELHEINLVIHDQFTSQCDVYFVIVWV
jgi:hypothetical protein